MQWTAGVVLEYVLLGLPVKRIGGGRFEPADFFRLPRRDELEPESDDELAALRSLAGLTAMMGGQVSDRVRAALTSAGKGTDGGQRH